MLAPRLAVAQRFSVPTNNETELAQVHQHHRHGVRVSTCTCQGCTPAEFGHAQRLCLRKGSEDILLEVSRKPRTRHPCNQCHPRGREYKGEQPEHCQKGVVVHACAVTKLLACSQ